MQTFLPYPNFNNSVACLDRKRLCKQRLEALQIYRIITEGRYNAPWSNHPAVRMWRGHTEALAQYYNTCLGEWAGRGYRNVKLSPLPAPSGYALPPWFGSEMFHARHRAVLLDKDYAWYSRFGWKEQRLVKVGGRYPYLWPALGEPLYDVCVNVEHDDEWSMCLRKKVNPVLWRGALHLLRSLSDDARSASKL